VLKDLGIVDVDVDALARILQLEESHYLDVKAREISPAKLAVHAVAFGNAAGGEIYVGIDELAHGERAWRGFDTVEAVNGFVQVLHTVFEGNDLLSLEFLRAPGVAGFVLHLIIEKSREVLTATDGDIYVRASAQKIPVRLSSHEEIERLKFDKGIATYEDMCLKDVDPEVITDSLAVTEFMIEAVPISEARPWLSSQRVLMNDSPTVAGTLLFADEPQVLLPKRSAIKVSRYKSTAREGHRDQLEGDPLTMEGPLVKQIVAAVDTVKKIVEATQIQESEGLVSVSYPTETLHEIITNAVLHRDYSIATDVQVRIFDNRIEVESPGRLPGHITPTNILDEQFARNGKIVRLANKFPNAPNKDTGEGLDTAFQKMRDIGLVPPEIREDGNRVVVTVRHERLASYEEQILEYLDVHHEINNSTARTITGEGSENKMKRTFEKMMDAQQIHRDPLRKGRATTYLRGPRRDEESRDAEPDPG
jgi:ATP-dependent DNA helicase RecG